MDRERRGDSENNIGVVENSLVRSRPPGRCDIPGGTIGCDVGGRPEDIAEDGRRADPLDGGAVTNKSCRPS